VISGSLYIKPAVSLSPSSDEMTQPFMSAVPKIKDLYDHVIRKVAHKWEDLVICLELDERGAKLEAIRRDFTLHGVEKCCLQALLCWIREEGRRPVSWATLLAVMREIECNSAARDVESALRGKFH